MRITGGEVKIGLINLGSETVEIKAGSGVSTGRAAVSGGVQDGRWCPSGK